MKITDFHVIALSLLLGFLLSSVKEECLQKKLE